MLISRLNYGRAKKHDIFKTTIAHAYKENIHFFYSPKAYIPIAKLSLIALDVLILNYTTNSIWILSQLKLLIIQ